MPGGWAGIYGHVGNFGFNPVKKKDPGASPKEIRALATEYCQVFPLRSKKAVSVRLPDVILRAAGHP